MHRIAKKRMMMKQYFDGFAKFRMNEARNFSERDYDYIQELKKELFNRMKGEEFNGWGVDPYHYDQMNSFLFTDVREFTDDSQNFAIYITPFFEPEDNSLDVEISYDGWTIKGDFSLKNLWSNLTGNKERDVEILYYLVIDTLKRLSDRKNLAKLLAFDSEIPDNQLFEVIIKAEDNQVFSDIVEYFPDVARRVTPESIRNLFDDYEKLEKVFGKNVNKWQEAFSKIWGEEESERFFRRIKKTIRGKNMFGV